MSGISSNISNAGLVIIEILLGISGLVIAVR